jgi:hypothetical protein
MPSTFKSEHPLGLLVCVYVFITLISGVRFVRLLCCERSFFLARKLVR